MKIKLSLEKDDYLVSSGVYGDVHLHIKRYALIKEANINNITDELIEVIKDVLDYEYQILINKKFLEGGDNFSNIIKLTKNKIYTRIKTSLLKNEELTDAFKECSEPHVGDITTTSILCEDKLEEVLESARNNPQAFGIVFNKYISEMVSKNCVIDVTHTAILKTMEAMSFMSTNIDKQLLLEKMIVSGDDKNPVYSAHMLSTCKQQTRDIENILLGNSTSALSEKDFKTIHDAFKNDESNKEVVFNTPIFSVKYSELKLLKLNLNNMEFIYSRYKEILNKLEDQIKIINDININEEFNSNLDYEVGIIRFINFKIMSDTLKLSLDKAKYVSKYIKKMSPDGDNIKSLNEFSTIIEKLHKLR